MRRRWTLVVASILVAAVVAVAAFAWLSSPGITDSDRTDGFTVRILKNGRRPPCGRFARGRLTPPR